MSPNGVFVRFDRAALRGCHTLEGCLFLCLADERALVCIQSSLVSSSLSMRRRRGSKSSVLKGVKSMHEHLKCLVIGFSCPKDPESTLYVRRDLPMPRPLL
jgi:hypothetical protein